MMMVKPQIGGSFHVAPHFTLLFSVKQGVSMEKNLHFSLIYPDSWCYAHNWNLPIW